MQRGELTVKQLCDVLEGQGVLSTQERIRVEGRAAAQRAKLEELQTSRSPAERRAAAAVDAIDVIASMGAPNASSPGLMVSDLAIAQAIAIHTGLRLVRFTADVVDRELVAATLSRPFALRHCVMPVGRAGEALVLAVASPLAEDVLGELRRTSGVEVEQVISPKSDIRNAIHQAFPQPSEGPAPRATVPAPGPETARRKSGPPVLLIVGGVAALLLALGALVVALVWSARADDQGGPPEEPADVEALAAGEPEAPGAAPSAQPAKAPPRGGRLQVRVTLRGVPPGAAISLDGERVDRTTLNVLNDGRPHELEVRARGYEPWLRTITPTDDEEIDVGLVPPEPAPAPGPRPESREPGPQGAAPAPSPSLARDPGF